MLFSEIIERNAKKSPEKVAIVSAEKKITYEELNFKILQVANFLKSEGIKKGDIVPILLPNCWEFVVSYFAILKLGAIVLPLNPSYKIFELECFLPPLPTSCVIATEEVAPVIYSLKNKLSSLKTIIVTGKKHFKEGVLFQNILKRRSPHLLKEKIEPAAPAVILYTSGVTSFPRAAVLTHQNLFSNIKSLSEIEKIKKDDVFLCALPLFHSFAMTVCMLLPLFKGIKIVLIEKFIPHLIVEAIRRYKISIFLGVPTMFAYIANLPGVEKKYFSSLRLCLSGGAPLSSEIINQFKEKFGIEILEGYGLTEASPVVCYNYSRGLKKNGSVGVPLPGIEVKIVDENNKELPTGEIGEIIVKGPNVMKEYYNNPEATSEVIREGWLHTGDLGKKDEDGYFYIVGRKKDVIIVSGFNVYPKEIEECLLSHPAVSEAAVIGVYDRLKGEAIKAYVVLKKGKEASYEEIINYCREKLAPYKVPRYLEFRDALPKSDTGKILKSELGR